MKRTYQYQLININKENKSTIDKHLKVCCWLHNYLLNHLRERDERREKRLTEYQLIKLITEIKKEHYFLKEVQNQVLQEVAKRVYKTWKRNEELKLINPKKGYPNFKPIHRYHSFTYSQPINKVGCGYKVDNSPLSKKCENRTLTLSFGRQNNHNTKITLKIRMERNLEGDVKTLTIKRKNNKYYSLFSCDNIRVKSLPLTGKRVGIDVNLEKKSYITLSNGIKYRHPQHYKKTEKKLIQNQQNLSRKIKGSQNWKDAKLQLAKKWEQMTNQFKHYSYRVANELVRSYDKIAVEDLKIRNMVKNKSLSKSIQQARWGILFKVLAEKTEIVARSLVRVNPKNTSQKCSNCNNLAKEKLKLSDRIFKCKYCELELDRDVNSARNILSRAEKVWLKPSLEIGGEKLTTCPIERGK